MLKDYAVLAFNTFRQRKVRTLLTMIGIFIGITAIVTLISLGQGLEQKIEEEFQKLGTDKILIMPKTAFAPPGSSTTGVILTQDDWDFIKKLKEVEESTVYIMSAGKIEFNEQTRFFNVVGSPVDEGRKLWKEMYGDFDIEAGRDLKKGDEYKVTVGNYHVTKNFYGKNINLGNSVSINGYDFKVVGYWEYIGSPEDDKIMVIPIDTAREVFGIPDRIDAIIVRTKQGNEPGKVAEEIKRKLRSHRNQEEGKEDFSIQTFEEVLRSFNKVIGIVQVVLIGVAAISLIVGGIGIMNTMFTAVLERTREIGIMKAIGARNSDIIKLYLIESGFLGMAGGIVGILLGWGASKGTEIVVKKVLLFEFIETYFPWYYSLAVLGFAFVVGIASGVLPAVRAAKQKPVDALRYE